VTYELLSLAVQWACVDNPNTVQSFFIQLDIWSPM